MALAAELAETIPVEEGFPKLKEVAEAGMECMTHSGMEHVTTFNTARCTI